MFWIAIRERSRANNKCSIFFSELVFHKTSGTQMRGVFMLFFRRTKPLLTRMRKVGQWKNRRGISNG